VAINPHLGIKRLSIYPMVTGLVMSLFLGMAAPADASAQSTREQQVKAAILYNLARFSVWPEERFQSEQSEFQICVQSADTMRPALEALSGKPINGREITLRELPSPDGVDAHCHILFLSASRTQAVNLEALADQGILTVGDDREFMHDGGGIALRRNGAKIGFSISQTTMKRAHIEPSSKILKLAIEVK